MFVMIIAVVIAVVGFGIIIGPELYESGKVVGPYDHLHGKINRW